MEKQHNEVNCGDPIPYCSNCGGTELNYLAAYVNGDNYECKNCGKEFIFPTPSTPEVEQSQVEEETIDIIQNLMAYGAIHTVEGVRYVGGTHAEYIKKAQNWLYNSRKYHPTPKKAPTTEEIKSALLNTEVGSFIISFEWEAEELAKAIHSLLPSQEVKKAPMEIDEAQVAHNIATRILAEHRKHSKTQPNKEEWAKIAATKIVRSLDSLLLDQNTPQREAKERYEKGYEYLSQRGLDVLFGGQYDKALQLASGYTPDQTTPQKEESQKRSQEMMKEAYHTIDNILCSWAYGKKEIDYHAIVNEINQVIFSRDFEQKED